MAITTTKISITVPNDTLELLDVRTMPQGRSGAASTHLQRFYDLVQFSARDAIDQFRHIGEINAMFEVWGNVPAIRGVHDAKHYISVDRSDAWVRQGASRMAVETTLIAMPMLQVLTMLDLCELFWAGAYREEVKEPADVIAAAYPSWRGLRK